ncbi:hypothetical protein L9F63_016219, partial [Diploptera punctata]
QEFSSRQLPNQSSLLITGCNHFSLHMLGMHLNREAGKKFSLDEHVNSFVTGYVTDFKLYGQYEFQEIQITLTLMIHSVNVKCCVSRKTKKVEELKQIHAITKVQAQFFVDNRNRFVNLIICLEGKLKWTLRNQFLSTGSAMPHKRRVETISVYPCRHLQNYLLFEGRYGIVCIKIYINCT